MGIIMNVKRTKNQLFKNIPSRDVVYKVINCFGLSNLDDNRNFTRHDINKNDTISKLYQLKPILDEYYLPCKARTYLNDITAKNCVTILRQLIRVYGYSVISREKYIKGDKFIIYQIISTDDRDYKPLITHCTTDKECVLTFE